MIIAGLALLLILSYQLLRISSVQTYLSQKISNSLSKKFQTEITVGKVDFEFFTNLLLKDLVIKDHHDQPMISCNELKVNILDFSRKSSNINLKIIEILNPEIRLIKYEDEDAFNIDLFAAHLQSKDTTSSNSSNFRIGLESFRLINGTFELFDKNVIIETDQVDPSHILLQELQLQASNLLFWGDSVEGKIDHLSFSDRAGFSINDFTTSVKMDSRLLNFEETNIKTDHSEIKLNGQLTYNGFKSFSNFVDSVRFRATVIESSISNEDIDLFAPGIIQIRSNIHIAGKMRGRLSNFKIRNIEMMYGMATTLEGDLTVSGLPNFSETFIHASLDKLATNNLDIASIQIADKSGVLKAIPIPKELESVNYIKASGYFTGFYNDFVSNALFTTNLGNFTTDIAFKNTNSSFPEYEGKLSVINFDLSEIAGIEQNIKTVSLNAVVSGKGFGPQSQVKIDGTLDSIYYNGYSYNDITINGLVQAQKFEGHLDMKDQNIAFDFDGKIDYSVETPIYDFTSTLHQAKLKELHLVDPKYDYDVSTKMELSFSGRNIDDIQGKVSLRDLAIKTSESNFKSKSIDLNTTLNDQNGERSIDLSSDFANGNAKGNFSFKHLTDAFTEVLNQYLPSVFKVDTINKELANEHITINLKLNDVNRLSNTFFPVLHSASVWEIYTTLDSDKGLLELDIDIPTLFINDIYFDNCQIKGKDEGKGWTLKTDINEIKISQTEQIRDFDLKSNVIADSIDHIISWDNHNPDSRSTGLISAVSLFDQYPDILNRINDSEIYLNDSLFYFNKDGEILLKSDGVFFNNIQIGSDYTSLKFDGGLSNQLGTELKVLFKQFNLSYFDVFTNRFQVDFDGLATGDASILGPLKSPMIQSHLFINHFGFNHNHLGDANIKTDWDNRKKAARVYGNVVYQGNVASDSVFIVDGYFYPNRDDANFDIDARLRNFKIHTISHYLSSITSDFTGKANGWLHLGGKTQKPILTGVIKAQKAKMKIDYLNTTYSFAHTIILDSNYIGFDNLILEDNNGITSMGNKAIASGKIYHNSFKDIVLDLDIITDKFTFLNTNSSHDPYYNGQAVGSGNIEIKGPVEDILLNINAKTLQGTQINIPLDYVSEIEQADFIRFVQIDTNKEARIQASTGPPQMTNLRMNFEFEATPDAEIQLIFDEQIGDVIKGRGKGDISMYIDMLGNFKMFGEYIIDEGDYMFTLRNAFSKQFKIKKGGSIKWTGSSYNADIDLQAIYPLRASLYDLGLGIDTSRNRIPIECLLHLTGDLMTPDIVFAIDFPGMSQFEKEQYLSVIEPNLNYQFLSLLVVGSFIQAEAGGINQAASGIGNTTIEYLSNQLSNWVSQLVKEVDFDFNYRPGNVEQLTNDEIEAAIRTQLFNDRLTIDGNVSIGGNYYTTDVNTSNFAGDFNIEYKITPEGQLRIKGFNRSNYQDLLNTEAPYTQGVGLFYRKEFETFSDLFGKKEKKQKKEVIEAEK